VDSKLIGERALQNWNHRSADDRGNEQSRSFPCQGSQAVDGERKNAWDSALPEVDYPTIQVFTFYPGASPEVMTTAVTAPLEPQFGEMPGLNQNAGPSRGVEEHPALDPAPAPLGLFYSWSHKEHSFGVPASADVAPKFHPVAARVWRLLA
jgi:hypothetical protein